MLPYFEEEANRSEDLAIPYLQNRAPSTPIRFLFYKNQPFVQKIPVNTHTKTASFLNRSADGLRPRSHELLGSKICGFKNVPGEKNFA